MKPKQIPRVIRIWLYAFGFYFGTIACSLLIVIGYFAFGGSMLAGLALIPLSVVVSMLFLWLMSWKCHNALEEWGLTTPKKKKEATK